MKALMEDGDIMISVIMPSNHLPPIVEFTKTATTQSDFINVLSHTIITSYLINESTGVIVSSGTGKSVNLTAPLSDTIETYGLYSIGDPYQIQFTSSISYISHCHFIRTASITLLDYLFTRADNLTSFAWDGVCNATSAEYAWRHSKIIDFPSMDFPVCTSFDSTFRDTDMTFAGTLGVSAGENFDSMFYQVTAPVVPYLDTSSGTSGTQMFGYFTGLCIGGLDTRNMPSEGAMFTNATELLHPTTAEIADLIDTDGAVYSYDCP